MKKRLLVAVLAVCMVANSFGMNVWASAATNNLEAVVSVPEVSNQMTEADTLQATDSVDINETNFPDDIFRQYVSDNCDSDKNGVLSAEEIAAVTSIDCSGKYEQWKSGMGIASLKGVELFKKLVSLNCEYNQLESLDISNNTMVTASGRCGDNLTWTLEDGTLTISGYGKMWDYNYWNNARGDDAPWIGYVGQLLRLELENGITYIGDSAFAIYNDFEGSLIIPNSVIEIGEEAFTGSGFNTIFFQGDAPHIGAGAFRSITANVYYPSWTSGWGDTIDDYNGELTWIPYEKGSRPWEMDFSQNAPTIWFIFAADELSYSNDIGYSQKQINMEISALCMIGLNNERQIYENVTINVTLPEGLSFEQNTDSRVFTKNLGTMSLEGNARADMSFTIYVDNEVVPEQFEIQAKLTADGYEYAQTDSFVIPVTIQESDVWHAEFKDPTTYQASYVYDEQTDMFEKDFYGDTPSIKIYEQAEENGLINSVEAWNEFQDAFKAMDDLSTVVDIPCRKRDMYQGIIFSVFEVSSELSDYTYNTSEVKDAKNILGVIKEIASAQYGIVVAEDNDLSSLTLDQRLKLGEITKAYFDNEWKTSVETDDVSKIFEAIEYIDNGLKYVEYIVNCYNLREMSEGYKAILRDMYENCPIDNQELRIALSDCIVCIEASEAAMVAKMVARGVDVAGREIIKIGLKELWTEVKTDIIATNPYVALLWASYKYSTLVSNKVFGADAIAENTVKMGAILEIRELILKSYEQHKEDFRVNREEINALRYLAAIDIFYQCLDEDCEIAYSFASSVSDSLMGKLEEFFGCTTYEDVKSAIRTYQHSYVLGHESVKTGWLNVLMEDYPEQYEKYKYLQTESENRIKKKYHVACPVDVYIYDMSGELVASAVGSEAYCKEDVPLTVMVVGDEKDIYFQGDDEQYTIKYVGTDSGTMDITIEEYDSEQTVSREIKHVDVPLTDGTCYQSTEKLAEENEYVLEDSNNSGKALSPIVDTKEEEQQKYTLQVKGGYVWDGTRVGFEAEYYAGEKATVYAVASEEHDFVHWKENGEVVSEDVTYTFTMDADKHLQAVFKEKGSEKVTDIFDDVKEGAWYVDAVQYVYDKGIMVGMGNLFQPNGAVTREQFVQVLYNNIGKPSVEGIENKFSDVKESWYTDAVLWASTAGIVSGYPNGKYGVGDNITREQMALMLYRYADLNNYDLTVNEDIHKQYPDGETVSDWAESAVDWAITQGIISGKGTGSDVSKLKIDPQGAATRAECASMMMKLLTKNQ